MQKILMCNLALTVTLVLTNGLGAQQGGNEMQQKVAAIKQAAADNQAALRHYQWVETTQVALKGEVKSTRQNSCVYGADGKIQKTPMATNAQPQPEDSSGRGGRLKAKIVEKKKEEMTDYMEQVKDLVGQYVPPLPDKIQAVVQAGNLAIDPSPATGLISIVLRNYAQQGDSMTLAIAQADKKLAKLSVNTYLSDPKDVVTLNVTFAALPDGTSFPAQTILNATAKQIVVTVSNGNYQKLGM